MTEGATPITALPLPCPNCGYDVADHCRRAGTAPFTCPECGRQLSAAALARSDHSQSMRLRITRWWLLFAFLPMIASVLAGAAGTIAGFSAPDVWMTSALVWGGGSILVLLPLSIYAVWGRGSIADRVIFPIMILFVLAFLNGIVVVGFYVLRELAGRIMQEV